MSEKIEIEQYQKFVVAMGEYYMKELTDTQVKMYANDLSRYPMEGLKYAFEEYRIKGEKPFFPLPCQLISLIINPKPEKDDVQEEVAKIIKAVSRYGIYSQTQAKEHLGYLWDSVEAIGGWGHICGMDSEYLGVIRKHLADLVGGAIKKRESKRLHNKYLADDTGETVQIPTYLESLKANVERIDLSHGKDFTLPDGTPGRKCETCGDVYKISLGHRCSSLECPDCGEVYYKDSEHRCPKKENNELSVEAGFNLINKAQPKDTHCVRCDFVVPIKETHDCKGEQMFPTLFTLDPCR